MRIIAGEWRGRSLSAPPGQATRPTADRVRQVLFDMLLHAPWAGRARIAGVRALDAFAGTGALGLEALSRGAAAAVFIERDRAALGTLRANIAACRAEPRCQVVCGDATAPPAGAACQLLFFDPPYAQGLVGAAFAALAARGWVARGALLAVETERFEVVPDTMGEALASRVVGAARISVFRAA